MAFPVGWPKKHRITIDSSKVVGTADLSNCPVLLTEDNFLAEAFSNSDNGGGDLRFSSDYSGSTRLSCEIVTWNTSTSKAEVYVKVPTISYNSDTIIYVWFDNTGQTQPARNAAFGGDDVWSNGYSNVYHFEGNSNNSVANSDNGTDTDITYSNTSPAFGNGKYADFNGSSSKINLGDIMDNQSQGAMSFLIKADAEPDSSVWEGVMSKNDNIQVDNSLSGTGRYTFRLRQSDGTWNDAIDSDWFTNYPETNWYRVSNLWGNSTSMAVRTNKTEVATNAYTGGNSYTTTSGDLHLGLWNNTSQHFDGKLDEFRVSTTRRSDDWEDTITNNLTAPDTFSTPSFERELSGTVSLSDSIKGAATYNRSNSSSVGIIDSLSRVSEFIRNNSDTVSVLDTLDWSRVIPRSISDTIGISDNISTILAISRSLSDTVGVTDTLQSSMQFARSISSTVSMTDTLDSVRAFYRYLTDTVGLTDDLAYRFIQTGISIVQIEEMKDIKPQLYNELREVLPMMYDIDEK